jgi:hypothetical protein
MDVRTGCTTRARVQQKLTQNKQVYSVINFLLPGHGWTGHPVHEEGGAEWSTRRWSLGKIPRYLQEIQARGSQRQTPNSNPPERSAGPGDSPRRSGQAPKLERGANTHAHEGQCCELGLQREGDVLSIAVTRPIFLQLNVKVRDAALGHKSGTPLAQRVTTKLEGIDIRNNGYPLDPI